MQTIEYDTGGYIVWGFYNLVDAYSKKVTGFKPSKGTLAAGRLRQRLPNDLVRHERSPGRPPREPTRALPGRLPPCRLHGITGFILRRVAARRR